MTLGAVVAVGAWAIVVGLVAYGRWHDRHRRRWIAEHRHQLIPTDWREEQLAEIRRLPEREPRGTASR